MSIENFDGTVLVLDLDETLVHIKRVLKNQAAAFGVAPDFSWQPQNDDQRLYVGWKRPGFDTFFQRIFEEVDAGNIFLCIWTTAAKRYAVQALRRTLGRDFDKIGLLWHREQYQQLGGRKDLCELAKHVGCRLSDIVMIDDNSLVFHNYLRAGGIVWLTPPFCDPSDQQEDVQLSRVVSALERRSLRDKDVQLCEEEFQQLPRNVRRFRQVILNWITYLHMKFYLDDTSLHVATHVVDDLFINQSDLIDQDPIQIATTCLYIGCCYGESAAVNLPQWIKSAGGHIAYDDIVACLQMVNHSLEYPLVDVGDVPFIILNDYLVQFRGLSSAKRHRLSQRARYVLELCLLDFEYKSFDANQLVWTVLFFVTTRDDASIWSGFALSSRYNAEESGLLRFVEQAAIQGDQPSVGRNESNERHQRKFFSTCGMFSHLDDDDAEVEED